VPRPSRSFTLLLALLGAVTRGAGAQQPPVAPPPDTAVVVGTVYDTLTGARLRLVIVRVLETGVSALTDDAGRYRITATPGVLHLAVRQLGYEPASVTVTAPAGVTRQDVYLDPAAVALPAVTVISTEDPARRIIGAAIARKHELFRHIIHDYRYAAAVKFVVRNLAKPADSAASVLLITETRTTAYWEQPARYQETIVARRQSSNLNAQDNLVTVGEIVNFNRERIDLRRYSLVSPIADDALEYYAYGVLDTLALDGRRIFRLALRPKSDASPLFVGVIDIADSTYDVLGIDVGVNRTVRFNFVRNIRYRQELRDMGGGRWMPYEIRLTGEVHIGIPHPGLPGDLAFEHVASLGDFRFDEGDRPSDLREFRVVVSDQADHADTAVWAGPRAIPLTPAESSAWARIDSLERIPPSFGARVLGGVGTAVYLSTDPDFFHFNRVDGAYVGLGRTSREIPGLILDTKLGYATGSERWQYRAGGDLRLSESRRLWVGASYHDETVSRPTFVSRSYNPTYRALLFRVDPLDYYRERGLTLALGTKLVDFTRLELRYNDERQTILPVITDYSLFSTRRPQRPNPSIVDGTLRSVSGSFTYDSRSQLKRQGADVYLPSLTWTRITLGTEIAAHDVLGGDFAFRRYSVLVERRQRTLNLGVTTIFAAGGIATGWVPPQRYFAVDFGMRALTFQAGGFNTPGDSNFTGTRAAMLTIRHDFDRLLFAKSRLPGIRKLPFTLSVHGGVFWTDFHDHPPNPGDALLLTAPSAYTEAGFGLGNLTPFLFPLNLAVHFTWQLSRYPTRRFQFGLGLTRS